MVNIKNLLKTAAIFGAGAGTGYVVGKEKGRQAAISQLIQILRDPDEFRKVMNEVVSSIISGYDHDLSADEEFEVRQILSDPAVLQEFIDPTGKVQVDKQRKAAAESKLNSLPQKHSEILSILTILPTAFDQPRRLNALYAYIVEHSIEEMSQTISLIHANHAPNTTERYDAHLKAFGIETSNEEERAHIALRALLRKQTNQGGKRIAGVMEFIKKERSK